MGVNGDIERRYLPIADLEVRRDADKKPTQLVGYAIRYDSLSEDMGFREVIAKGAFSGALRSDPDVRAMVEHNPEKIIGRTRARTLTLEEDDAGVKVTIDPPDTQIGRDVVKSIERGDLSSMSFGFRALNDMWGTVDGGPVRTINEAELFDVSVVAFPSYADTTIAVRSLNRWRKTRMTDETVTGTTEQDQEQDQETRDAEPARPAERRTQPTQPEQRAQAQRDPAEWRDHRTGNEVRVLRHDQRMADLFPSEDRLSLGRAIRAMIIGDWSDAELEQRALGTGANPTAGVLVPNPLAASVVDKARNLTALVRAGARTVDMSSTTMTIARVATDATVEVKGENTALTGSDVEFDAIELTAYTLGVLVKISRELAADAPNAVSIIEDTIAKKLAERIDYYGLQGSGSAQPLGLINFASTNTENVGGSVDWDNVLNGMAANETDNHMSNALLGSPTNFNVLRQLKNNSEANNYSAPPTAVQNLQMISTSNMPNTDMAVGDFTKFLIGLRQGVMIEVSTEADTAFAAHQMWVKATWRGCFNAEHRDAFCLLQSIS